MKNLYKALLNPMTIVFGGVASASLVGCGMCGNYVHSEHLSPNQAYKAVVFQRDCGATTGFSTQISIIAAERALRNKMGDVYISDGHPKDASLRIEWESENELIIRNGLSNKVFKSETEWGSSHKILIRYE